MDKVEHFEIPADDHDRALRFYSGVLSWELNPIPGVNYTGCSPRPFAVNGVVQRDNERRILGAKFWVEAQGTLFTTKHGLLPIRSGHHKMVGSHASRSRRNDLLQYNSR